MSINLLNNSTLSDVYTIVESKIQYIESQAHRSMEQCMSQQLSGIVCPKKKAQVLTQNFDQMIQNINQQTGELKLLQIIKCWMREENLEHVMTLLHNNAYRQHTEESIEKMLKKGALELLQLQYN